jgi:hypothetical protein
MTSGPCPPHLSDRQRWLVETAAVTLPPEQRAAFLERVLARLAGEPAVPAVEAAISAAMETTRTVFLCDAMPKETHT